MNVDRESDTLTLTIDSQNVNDARTYYVGIGVKYEEQADYIVYI